MPHFTCQNCLTGEHITLSLEANNPHTPDTTMLCRSSGEQLGYFKAEITGDKVRTRLDEGYRPGDAARVVRSISLFGFMVRQ